MAVPLLAAGRVLVVDAGEHLGSPWSGWVDLPGPGLRSITEPARREAAEVFAAMAGYRLAVVDTDVPALRDLASAHHGTTAPRHDGHGDGRLARRTQRGAGAVRTDHRSWARRRADRCDADRGARSARPPRRRGARRPRLRPAAAPGERLPCPAIGPARSDSRHPTRSADPRRRAATANPGVAGRRPGGSFRRLDETRPAGASRARFS